MHWAISHWALIQLLDQRHGEIQLLPEWVSLSFFKCCVNGLIISKIEKKKPEPVLKKGVTQQPEGLLKKTDVSYYKIPVEYEIKGNFLGYIKFKRAIAKSKKMLNFDKESISIVQNDTTGAIIATGELTIVGIPDEFF